MPSTAKRMGLNPYSLNDNIKGGIMYYKNMYKMFGSMELALAAYNAGPGNVKRYNNTVPPYAETKRFIAKITHVPIPKLCMQVWFTNLNYGKSQ